MEKELPILAYEGQIVSTVRDNQVTVITAETGAGKSTQVPLMLLRAGFSTSGVIGVTEPRRVAAISLAEWVAELHGSPLGQTVGYQIRADRRASRETRVRYMTEGILLRQMHSDPSLKQYSCLVVDEVHERGVNQDLILALLKQVLCQRPDLKVVIMSATIKAGSFSKHFGNAPIIQVPGRMFPVETRYARETPINLKAAIDAFVDKVAEIVRSREPGDILGFFPDEKSIKLACRKLEGEGLGELRILPLYGNQAPDEQREVFVRGSKRRVIVATNIAETSITIDGVKHVVDTGLIKAMVYVSASMSALEVTDHSKAGCDQRKGRAGRTAEGICHRLFSLEDWEERPGYTKPELLRMSLDAVLLHLRTLGYSMDNIMRFEFMDPPGDERWKEAEDRLALLGALDENREVTEDGQRMERLPVAPMLGRMLLSADTYGCTEELATVVAGLTARPVFVRPREKEDDADRSHRHFKVADSDALTLLRVWEAWCTASENGKRNEWARANFLSSRALREIERNQNHILDTLEGMGIKVASNPDPKLIRRAVAAGLIVNLCKFMGMHAYEWQGRGDIYIHPGSALFKEQEPRYMVCAEIVETTKTFARGCTAIDETWLDELLPRHACDMALRIERPFFGHRPPHLIETLSWQGTKIREQELPDSAQLTVKHLGELALEFVREIVEQHGNPIHPDNIHNREVWKTVMEAGGLDPLQIAGMGFLRLMEGSKALQAMAVLFIKRFKEAGAQTFDAVKKTDIKLPLENFLTPEQVAEHEEKMKARMKEAEQRRRWQEETQQRMQEKREARQAEREALMAPLSEEIRELQEQLQPLTRTMERMDLERDLRTTQDRLAWSYTEPEEMQRKIRDLRFRVNQLARTQAAQTELSEKIWETVILEHFPCCPLCEGAWQPEGRTTMVCDGAHNLERLVPLTAGHRSSRVGMFVTNRDEDAAELRVSLEGLTLKFKIARDGAWTGKVFKSVRYEPRVVLLPEELVGERESIITDIAELRNAREELEAITRRLQKAEEKVGAGAMKRLTFKVERGVAVAVDNGKKYRAAYQDPYPNEGEAWFCRIGQDVGTLKDRVTEVYPEFKAGSVSTPDDLEELQELLREAYPGLPPELLQVQ